MCLHIFVDPDCGTHIRRRRMCFQYSRIFVDHVLWNPQIETAHVSAFRYTFLSIGFVELTNGDGTCVVVNSIKHILVNLFVDLTNKGDCCVFM